MLIAHIADLHVSDDGLPVHDLVDTDAATRAVVAALNALDPAPDVIIAAGDLTHDGDGVAAARAKALLAGLPAPVLVCTGNHDRRESLRAAFGRHASDVDDAWMAYTVEDFPVRLIALDAATDDPFVGAMPEAEAEWLAARLAEQPDRPTILFLHHPPFDTGIGWMDAIGITIGRDALWRVVAAHRNILAVLSGHLHRPMAGRWAGVAVYAAPSVMDRVEFIGMRPDGSPEVAISAAPGYALHETDGTAWSTRLCFVDGHEEDWAAAMPDAYAENSVK